MRSFDHQAGRQTDNAPALTVDFVKYPSLIDVEYFNVTMEPGDCLFIPYKWFHQVRSYDRNIAVNVWWKHKAAFIPQDCDMEPNQTLDKFNFSSLQQEASNQEAPDMMTHLENLVAQRNLTFKQFEEHLQKDPLIFGDQPVEWNEQLTAVATKLFETLDKDNDGEISGPDIKLMEEDSSAQSVIENQLAKIEDLIEDQVESNQPDSVEEQEPPRDEL